MTLGFRCCWWFAWSVLLLSLGWILIDLLLWSCLLGGFSFWDLVCGFCFLVGLLWVGFVVGLVVNFGFLGC